MFWRRILSILLLVLIIDVFTNEALKCHYIDAKGTEKKVDKDEKGSPCKSCYYTKKDGAVARHCMDISCVKKDLGDTKCCDDKDLCNDQGMTSGAQSSHKMSLALYAAVVAIVIKLGVV